MARIGLLIVFAAMLAGCAANMQLGTTLTSRGVINQANLSLGEVRLWNRPAGTTAHVLQVDPALSPIVSTVGRDAEQASFEGSARLVGGIDLPETLRGDLEAEVASRSRIELRGIRSQRFSNPIVAMIESVRANPEAWYAGLDLDRSSDLQLPEGMLLVMVTAVTIGESLEITVDRELAAGGTFTSSVFTATGPVRFRVTDAQALQIVSAQGSATLFAEFQVYSTRRGPNGLGFGRVTDESVLQDLAIAIASGR